MSLINDALKQARKTPPDNTPTALPPLEPLAHEPAAATWLLPAIVILLLVAAIFSIGWAMSHHAPRTVAVAPKPAAVATPPVVAIPPPVVTPPPAAPPPPPVKPPVMPKLQGIFYSPSAPSAIVNGKTVRPGDHFGPYRVKAISKDSVTLVGPDKKEIQLDMDN